MRDGKCGPIHRTAIGQERKFNEPNVADDFIVNTDDGAADGPMAQSVSGILVGARKCEATQP
jgi:hypothetical protein